MSIKARLKRLEASIPHKPTTAQLDALRAYLVERNKAVRERYGK